MHLNSFNLKAVQNLLQEENAFISDIMKRLPIPVSSIQRGMNEEDLLIKTPQPEDHDALKPKTSRARTIEELQDRLTQLKGKKTLHYKDKLVKKGLKNRIKKREKKLKFKQNKNPKSKPNPDGENLETEEKKVKPQKPIFNSQGNMVFSKFDFHQNAAISGKKNKKTKKNDPQTLLQNLEKQNEQLRELKSSGETAKAEELKQEFMWKSALAKATGQKVKDNPELLKKSIKKRDQQVQKSKKKWKSREEGVQKAKEERQKKRADNINKRKKDKKMTKLKKAAKKGKVIPGF